MEITLHPCSCYAGSTQESTLPSLRHLSCVGNGQICKLMTSHSAPKPLHYCLQEAEAAPAEGSVPTDGERGAAAEQSSAEGADAEWDMMKLLPSTVADPYPVGTSEGAPTFVLPLDKEVRLKLQTESCLTWPETGWGGQCA